MHSAAAINNYLKGMQTINRNEDEVPMGDDYTARKLQELSSIMRSVEKAVVEIAANLAHISTMSNENRAMIADSNRVVESLDKRIRALEFASEFEKNQENEIRSSVKFWAWVVGIISSAIMALFSFFKFIYFR